MRDLIFSPEDKQYIQEQDRIRRRLYEDAKRGAEREISKKKTLESVSIKNLKNQQKILKEESNKYKIDKNKIEFESIQKTPIEKAQPLPQVQQ